MFMTYTQLGIWDHKLGNALNPRKPPIPCICSVQSCRLMRTQAWCGFKPVPCPPWAIDTSSQPWLSNCEISLAVSSHFLCSTYRYSCTDIHPPSSFSFNHHFVYPSAWAVQKLSAKQLFCQWSLNTPTQVLSLSDLVLFWLVCSYDRKFLGRQIRKIFKVFSKNVWLAFFSRLSAFVLFSNWRLIGDCNKRLSTELFWIRAQRVNPRRGPEEH
jgi:hypothetical protein